MNEVNNPASIALPRATSSPGTVDTQAETGGKILPQKAEQSDSSAASPSGNAIKSEDVEKMVETLREYVQSVQRDLHFTVDEDLERTVVKVVDRSSGELIRQIPDEAFLELARKLNDDGEFQLFDALG